MKVYLEYATGEGRFIDVPDYIRGAYYVADVRSPMNMFEWIDEGRDIAVTALPRYPSIRFEPSGFNLFGLSPRGVSMWPIWREANHVKRQK